MALINREQALSHPFANGQYDKEHADEHFIMGFEDYKEWLEDLPIVEAIPKDQYEARLKADMIAMLTEIQLEIHELENPYPHDYDNLLPLAQHNAFYDAKSTIEDLVDEKINALRGDNE